MIFVLQVLQLVFAMIGVTCTIQMLIWRFRVKPKYDRLKVLIDLAKREHVLWFSKIFSNPEEAQKHKEYAEEITQQYYTLCKELGIE